MEDLEEDRHLGPGEAAHVCDFLCMHGYPIYAMWAASSTDALLLPFLGLITRWLGGKDVLFAEFGAPTMPHLDQQTAAVPRTVRVLDEEEAALFTRRALDALHRFGFLGAFLWCYGDYARELWHTPPLDEATHERSFGLWRHDYSAKPAARRRGVVCHPLLRQEWSRPSQAFAKYPAQCPNRVTLKEGCASLFPESVQTSARPTRVRRGRHQATGRAGRGVGRTER